MRTAFRDFLGVEESIADVLVTLYDLAGAPVQPKALSLMINSHRPISRGAIHERIRVLRQAMESESVDFEEACGYSLTEVGMRECDQALACMSDVLAKARLRANGSSRRAMRRYREARQRGPLLERQEETS
jgi:hypothetical protein